MVAIAARCATMLDRLELETRTHHSSAEADLFRVLDNPAPATYRHFLAAVYHFEYAIESRLAEMPELPLRFVASSMKTGRLGDDLLALGVDGSVLELLARPVELAGVWTSCEAFGWLYVVQRNTLQHAALYRALAPRLRVLLRTASRYLTAHVSDVHERWHQLGTHLQFVARCPDDARQIISAAHAAFEQQHRWYAAAAARY
jgi:heme oxygenase